MHQPTDVLDLLPDATDIHQQIIDLLLRQQRASVDGGDTRRGRSHLRHDRPRGHGRGLPDRPTPDRRAPARSS